MLNSGPATKEEVMKDELFERRGIFRLSRKMIFEYPQVVMRLMGKVLIVRAETVFMGDCVEYQAFSPWFDLCHPAAIPMEYEVETNGIDVMFRRR
jgi:hypothetical protein